LRGFERRGGRTALRRGRVLFETTGFCPRRGLSGAPLTVNTPASGPAGPGFLSWEPLVGVCELIGDVKAVKGIKEAAPPMLTGLPLPVN
jgi:hypothetical protein